MERALLTPANPNRSPHPCRHQKLSLISQTRNDHLDTNKARSDIARAAGDELQVDVERSLLVSRLDGGDNLHETRHGLGVNGAAVEMVEQQIDAALRVVDHPLLSRWRGRLESCDLALQGVLDGSLVFRNVGAVTGWVLHLRSVASTRSGAAGRRTGTAPWRCRTLRYTGRTCETRSTRCALAWRSECAGTGSRWRHALLLLNAIAVGTSGTCRRSGVGASGRSSLARWTGLWLTLSWCAVGALLLTRSRLTLRGTHRRGSDTRRAVSLLCKTRTRGRTLGWWAHHASRGRRTTRRSGGRSTRSAAVW